jgi:hypothetical protein
MVQRQHLRKTAVLVSSVLLVCALIAYRANAFNLRSMLGGGDSEGTVMSGTKSSTRIMGEPAPAGTGSGATTTSGNNSSLPKPSPAQAGADKPASDASATSTGTP